MNSERIIIMLCFINGLWAIANALFLESSGIAKVFPLFAFMACFVSYVLLVNKEKVYTNVHGKGNRFPDSDFAETNSYQLRMAPHFLFNCLMTLKALRNLDERKFDEYIVNLSSLLRYSYEHAELKEVSLKKELEFTQLYFSLVKDKFRKNCDLVINNQLGLEYSKIVIAPYVIQTLVENSVKHLALQSDYDVLIEINLSRDANGIVQIVVSDNGKTQLPKKDYGKSSTYSGIKREMKRIYHDSQILLNKNNRSGFETVIRFQSKKHET